MEEIDKFDVQWIPQLEHQSRTLLHACEICNGAVRKECLLRLRCDTSTLCGLSDHGNIL